MWTAVFESNLYYIFTVWIFTLRRVKLLIHMSSHQQGYGIKNGSQNDFWIFWLPYASSLLLYALHNQCFAPFHIVNRTSRDVYENFLRHSLLKETGNYILSNFVYFLVFFLNKGSCQHFTFILYIHTIQIHT